jgi:hypothetical protein
MRALFSVLSIASLLTLARPAAAAPGGGTGIGVGAARTLTDISGPTLVYQAPMFHLEGMLGFLDSQGNTTIDAAGRFFYEIHTAAAADFSLGGGLGFSNLDNGADTFTDLHLELGAQIRAFVTSNVALTAALGFGIVSVDGAGDNIVSLLGDLTGGFGINYFFW